MQQPINKRQELLIPLAISLAVIIARLAYAPLITDDAYITFRYVNNIIQGVSFVYNSGERVLGTTTPLYTFALAGLVAVTPLDVIGASLLLNMIADLLTMFLLCSLGRGARKPWIGIAAALLFAIHPASVWVAVSGMETPVYILLLVLTFYAYAQERFMLTSLLCGLVFLTRPDGLIAAATLLFHYLLRKRRLPIREATRFLLVIAPWLIFSTLYFGSPLPSSLMAKSVAYAPLRDPLYAGKQFWRFFTTILLPLPTSGMLHGLFSLFLVALFFAGFPRIMEIDHHLEPLFIFPLLYVAAFTIANKATFLWYLNPLIPFVLLVSLFGYHGFCEQSLSSHGPQTPSPSAAARANLLSFVLVPLCLAIISGWQTYREYPRQLSWVQGRELLYKEIAQGLNTIASQGQTLAGPEIGALGYYFQGPILDTTGLISPQAIPYLPALKEPAEYQGAYAIPTDLILDYSPEYLVTAEIFVAPTLLRSERFLKRYENIASIETEVFLGYEQSILIFRLVAEEH